MKVWFRALVALLLLLALGGLFAHADVTADQRSPYPDAVELASNYDAYVGETILVFGTVTVATDSELTIETESNGVTMSLQVTGTTAAVDQGGVVQVYGTLEPDKTLAAERVEVVNSSYAAELYKYAASAIGALGFLLLFFRYWRIETETWTLEARDG